MATHCEILFGASLRDLTLDRVMEYLKSESVENERFESKATPDGEVRREDLGREIAAFANTDGGALLVGGPKLAWLDLADRTRGRRFDGPPTGHRQLPKDVLRDRLLGSIHPVPAGVVFATFALSAERGLTIVEVEKSAFPPHQVDGTYCFRLDGATRPAPHGLVEALFRQRRSPHLTFELDPIEDGEASDKSIIRFRFRVLNRGAASAINPVVVFVFPYDISPRDLGFTSTRDGGFTAIFHDFGGRPLHPSQRTATVTAHFGGFPKGALGFEVALFAQDTPGRYSAYKVPYSQFVRTTSRIGDIRLMEEDLIAPDRPFYPYSIWARDGMP